MIVFLVFLITMIFSLISYKKFKLKLLSPTLWTSIAFCSFSLIYILTYSRMAGDISFLTFIVIVFAVIACGIGEFCACTIVWRKKRKCENDVQLYDIEISRIRTYIISAAMFIVGVIRFINMYKFVIMYRGATVTSLGNLVGQARYVMNVSGENMNLGGTIVAQGVYVSSIICYAYIFCFIYKIVVNKEKNMYLLLPVLADCFIEISTTGRTPFIMIAIAFFVSYFYCTIIMRKGKKIKISKKVYLYTLIFLIAFFAYGNSRNLQSSSQNETDIIEVIQAYSCAAIYGLNTYLSEPWNKNIYFGQYTLQNIYSLLNIEHSYVPDHHLKTFYFGKTEQSNIYTALVLYIQDYGIIGMLIIVCIFSFIFTKIISKLWRISIKNKYFVIYFFFSVIGVYCFFYMVIADRFSNYIFNPLLMLRYSVYAVITSCYILKFKFIDKTKEAGDKMPVKKIC